MWYNIDECAFFVPYNQLILVPERGVNMAKLTKKTIKRIIRNFPKNPPENGEIGFIGDHTKEEMEDTLAAYRVKYLHEDIDKVIAEVNAKRDFSENGTQVQALDNAKRSTEKPPKSFLSNLFGKATLQDVEIEYQGAIIRIGHVDLH